MNSEPAVLHHSMLVKSKGSTHHQKQNACLSCGTTQNIGKRRYCSVQCRQHLRQKLNTRSGLLQALNTRYATFYFTDQLIILDIVPHGIREIFRYAALRELDMKPAEDFGKMTNWLGRAWWEEEKRTTKNYLASRHVLGLAERLDLAEGLTRPRLIRVPTVKPENLILLDMAKADLGSREVVKIIKNAYRRQVKIHHPDAGGQAAAFRKIHEAYKDLLRWADNPTFIRRRGFPDKWYYDGDNKKWVQPIPIRK
ncbi:MAG: J domain-containing protein [Deltaproteobacteria bacterium]